MLPPPGVNVLFSITFKEGLFVVDVVNDDDVVVISALDISAVVFVCVVLAIVSVPFSGPRTGSLEVGMSGTVFVSFVSLANISLCCSVSCFGWGVASISREGPLPGSLCSLPMDPAA